jgi:F420-dependent oxidoreductase-like protein
MVLRISLTGGGPSVDRIIDSAQKAEADGFSGLWFPGGGGALDPLVLLGVVGRATERIGLGTSIVQTYTRHPVLMAQQAATVGAAIGDSSRFTLGIGVSHRPIIEGVFGLDYDTNARHLHEYLTVLSALLGEGRVSFTGEEYTARTEIAETSVGLVVAALAKRSLTSAGELSDGTVTWMANAASIESLIAPTIAAAAEAAGRPAPRVVVGLPIAVTDDEDGGRETAAGQFAVYGTLPNYQRVLAAGGISTPAEAAIVGNEQQVGDAITALFAAGATELWAAPFPAGARCSSCANWSAERHHAGTATGGARRPRRCIGESERQRFTRVTRRRPSARRRLGSRRSRTSRSRSPGRWRRWCPCRSARRRSPAPAEPGRRRAATWPARCPAPRSRPRCARSGWRRRWR